MGGVGRGQREGGGEKEEDEGGGRGKKLGDRWGGVGGQVWEEGG